MEGWNEEEGVVGKVEKVGKVKRMRGVWEVVEEEGGLSSTVDGTSLEVPLPKSFS